MFTLFAGEYKPDAIALPIHQLQCMSSCHLDIDCLLLPFLHGYSKQQMSSSHYVLQLFQSPVKESLSFSFVFLGLFLCCYFNFVVLFCFVFFFWFLLFIEPVFFLSFLQTEKKRSGMWRREVNYVVCEVNCVNALIFVERVKLIRSSQ